MDREVVLEALGAICNTPVISTQTHSARAAGARLSFSAPTLSTSTLVSSVLAADLSCLVSRCNLSRIQTSLAGGVFPANQVCVDVEVDKGKVPLIIDEEEFFDPSFDYDFTKKKDKRTFYRGGEKYERPCGWNRFALKVLDKYDENAWLGNTSRSTESVPGEWPVSYHGTTEKGAKGIIAGHFQAGPRQKYGRGVYSTPDLDEASGYAKRFTSKKDGKRYKVIMQNRINPKFRVKNGNYWLIPIKEGTSSEDERRLVEQALRPYGLLLKED